MCWGRSRATFRTATARSGCAPPAQCSPVRGRISGRRSLAHRSGLGRAVVKIGAAELRQTKAPRFGRPPAGPRLTPRWSLAWAAPSARWNPTRLRTMASAKPLRALSPPGFSRELPSVDAVELNHAAAGAFHADADHLVAFAPERDDWLGMFGMCARRDHGGGRGPRVRG